MHMPTREPERLLTVEEIAEQLGANPETVRRWLRSGDLRGIRLAKKLGWRVPEREFQRFMDARMNVGEGEQTGQGQQHDSASEAE